MRTLAGYKPKKRKPSDWWLRCQALRESGIQLSMFQATWFVCFGMQVGNILTGAVFLLEGLFVW